MRYDNLLRAIERASARYEAEMQAILQRFTKTEAATAQQLVSTLKKPQRRKALHWTQRPENKAKLQRQLRKAVKAKKAARKAKEVSQ